MLTLYFFGIFTSTPAGAEVRFDQVKAEVFQPACNGCHNPQNRIRFPNYDLAIRFLDKIQMAVFEKGSMPPKASPLTDYQLALLKEWILQGAKNEVGHTAPPLNPEPPWAATFQSLKYHVFDLKCTPCHQEKKINHRIPLEDYALAVNPKTGWVVPGQPTASKLYQIVDLPSFSTEAMPPYDSAAPRLRPHEILLIKQWIELGAPEY